MAKKTIKSDDAETDRKRKVRPFLIQYNTAICFQSKFIVFILRCITSKAVQKKAETFCQFFGAERHTPTGDATKRVIS